MRERRGARHSRGLSAVFGRQGLETPTQARSFLGRTQEAPLSAGSSNHDVGSARAHGHFSQMLANQDDGRRFAGRRPLQFDQNLFETKSEELMQFLEANNFEAQTGYSLPRVATDAPPQATIEQIFAFLRRMIDPNCSSESFKLGFGKLLRHLEFPAAASIRRPALVSAGSSTVWPQVLDGLYWLMCTALKVNEVTLPPMDMVKEKSGLDGLMERQIVKEFQAERNSREHESLPLLQNEVDMALDQYIATMSVSLQQQAEHKASVAARAARLEDQKRQIQALTENENTVQRRKQTLELEIMQNTRIHADLQGKQQVLKSRREELALRRQGIASQEEEFKRLFIDAKPGNYTAEKLEDFLRDYRNTYRRQLDDVMDLKAIRFKLSTASNGLEHKLMSIEQLVQDYKCYAPANFEIDVSKVLDEDLGKTAKTLLGRTLEEMENELKQVSTRCNDRVEQLQVELTRLDQSVEELTPLVEQLKSRITRVEQSLEVRHDENKASKARLEQEAASLSNWVAGVMAANQKVVADKTQERLAALNENEAAEIALADKKHVYSERINPIEERLTALYDTFSTVYNQLGLSINGMLGASSQIVKSMETDSQLSNFSMPPEFEREQDVPDSMFAEYCGALMMHVARHQ